MTLDGFTDSSTILRAGVYALCAKSVVIYVGKSKSMIARINTHKRVWVEKRQGKAAWMADRLGIPGLLFDEIHIRPCRLEDLDRLEAEMIDRYKPRYNVQLKNSQKVSAPITLRIGSVILGLNARPPAPTTVIERRC